MISEQDIKKLSELARIEVHESEIKKLQHDLERILGYVEHLNRAETGAIESLGQVTGLSNVMVDDGERAAVEANRAELLHAAPRHDQSFIKVPSVWKK